MRAVFGLVLIAGIGLAGTAVYVVRGQMEATSRELARQRAAAAQQVATVEVIAVNRQIKYGEKLTPEDVQTIRYAEPFLLEGVFLTMEDLFPEGEAIHREVIRQMEANEPILAIKVTDPGEPAGISSQLEPGMRAVAINVDVASGVSGFLRPGDRVDVYWTGILPGNDASEITRLIENGIELLAVDQNTDDNIEAGTIARTVTVRVTREQGGRLVQAQSTGSLSLSLVGTSDQTTAGGVEVDQRTLLGLPEDVAPVEQAPVVEDTPCYIYTRNGTEVTPTEVECPD
jgi:pilus assembly protein CpaB